MKHHGMFQNAGFLGTEASKEREAVGRHMGGAEAGPLEDFIE